MTRQAQRLEEREWLQVYIEQYHASLMQPGILEQLLAFKRLLEAVRDTGHKIIFAGNGGSAAIASHCAVDFTKMAGIRSINFNEANLITCFANDYGYEHWLERAIVCYADAGDVVVLVSSSGKSPNMINAAHVARERGLTLVTFTGFSPDNPLRGLGHLNYWVPGQLYNVIEMTHHIWLLAVCDLLAGLMTPHTERREIPHAVQH